MLTSRCCSCLKTESTAGRALPEGSPLAGKPPVRSFTRAFRPLLLWGLASSLLLFWDGFRKTNLTFRILSEKGTLSRLSTTVDGVAHQPRGQVQPGWRTIRAESPGFEPFEKKVFLWIGTNDLGDIALKRSRGNLTIKSWPVSPRSIRLQGDDINLEQEHQSFANLPTGDYSVTADFGPMVESKRVRIDSGGGEIEFRPSVGWLSANTSHLPAELRIEDRNFGRTIDQPLPLAPLLVRSGDYVVSATRNGYTRSMPISVGTGQTNTILVEFPYGELRIASEPTGAEIRINGVSVGRSPLTNSEIAPGLYAIEVLKEGYETALLSVTVGEREVKPVSMNLVNVRYSSSMRAAAQALNTRPIDYVAAQSALGEALVAQPGDERALRLTEEVERQRSQAAASTKAEAERTERESRRAFAARSFEEETRGEKDAPLFETHVWTTRNSVDEVRAALKKAVSKPDFSWEKKGDLKLNENTFLMRANEKGFGNQYRHFALLACQIAPGECEIRFKLWDYVLGKNVTLSLFKGVTPDSIVPIHANYVQDAEGRIKAVVGEFKERLFRELP